MAEDKVEPREVNWRQLMPWTALFQGFRVALDPNKLVLAALGILSMALGWWLLAFIFDYKKPQPSDFGLGDLQVIGESEAATRWEKFKEEREKWHVMHHAAGTAFPNAQEEANFAYDAGDLADSPAEWANLSKVAPGTEPTNLVLNRSQLQDFIKAPPVGGVNAGYDAKVWLIQHRVLPPAGGMRTLPWDENRGPNPFLLVTGQAGSQWTAGRFWDWLLFNEIPVLIEPLIKLFSPVVYFFNPRAGSLVRFYCLLVMLWTLLVWGFFGGAISRIATVQVARQEKIGLTEAVRFSARKYL